MAQLLYIALGFGVGISAAGAVGTIALLLWTRKYDEGVNEDAPEANSVVDAESQTSEPDRDQVTDFEATLARQGFTMITEDSMKASIDRMIAVDPSVTKNVPVNNWSAISREALGVNVGEIDYHVVLRLISDPKKVEDSFCDAQRELDTSSR